MKKATNNFPKQICGAARYPIYIRIVLHVFFHYIWQMFKCKFSPIKFIKLCRRALLFLSSVRHNKIVKLGTNYKLQLYFPAYPTGGFFRTLDKFLMEEPGPVTVVLSMTKACNYQCKHCYQKLDSGTDTKIDQLINTVKQMQQIGVTMFDIEGGEPFLKYDRLLQLLNELHNNTTELWINTTGYSVTEARVAALKNAGLFGVMISIHSEDPDEHNCFTGSDGAWDVAFEAVKLFNQYGIMTVINCCASFEMVNRGGVTKLLDFTTESGCSYVQLIHPKSAGGWLGHKPAKNEKEFQTQVRQLHLDYNSPGPFENHTAVSAQVFEEQPDIYGCTAGGIDRFYIGADGEVQPCEFLNISFGNINDEDFVKIFARMRDHFPKPGINWLCCTQAKQINESIKSHHLIRTPIPWEITQTFIDSWDKGEKTPLYKKLGIYDK